MEAILSALGSVGAAASTGGLSAVFGGLFGWLQLKAKKKYELEVMKVQAAEKQADRQHDLDVLRQEGANAEHLASISADAEKVSASISADADKAKASYAALTEARQNDKSSYSSGLMAKMEPFKGWFGQIVGSLAAFMMFAVDVYRGVVRPTLTFYGWALLTFMFIKIHPAVDSLSNDQRYALATLIVNAVVFMTAKATVYWFGDRGKVPDLLPK